MKWYQESFNLVEIFNFKTFFSDKKIRKNDFIYFYKKFNSLIKEKKIFRN